MIERLLYQHLTQYLEFFPVVAILGCRQVGKTTLAKQIQKTIAKKCTYLDLERLEDLVKLDNPSLYFDKKQDECIILDEIQRKPEIFLELRSIIDQNRIPGRFLILGSSSPELLKQSAESLAVRISYSELTPFLVTEVGIENAFLLWFRGGFPTAFLVEDDTMRNQWFHSFITTYIERDLPMLGLNTSSIQLRKFVNMLSSVQGATLNIQMLSRSMGTSSTTITRYIDFLEKSFLIRKLLPYYSNTKKRLVKSPKLYIRDTGILHYLHGINNQDALWDNSLIGVSWESFVIEQVIVNIKINQQAWYYRTQDGTECDLLITENDVPKACIEVKLTSAPKKTKSFTTVLNDLKTMHNFIIIPECSESFQLNEKIMVCSLSDFLTKFQPQL